MVFLILVILRKENLEVVGDFFQYFLEYLSRILLNFLATLFQIFLSKLLEKTLIILPRNFFKYC